MSEYLIIAGVNGAGKTTLYETAEGFSGLPRVNLDEIVRGFGSWKNPEDVAKAEQIAVRKIKECFNQNMSFNQETTLCGRSILRNIEYAKKAGFCVNLFFIGIESPEIAISRIKSRIEKGGHGVPDEEVRRRYKESLSNLMRILPICDNVQIYDNTKSFRKIAQFQGGMICWQTEDLPAWYCSNAGQKHDANRRKRRDRHDPSFKVEAGEVSRNRSLHHSVLT